MQELTPKHFEDLFVREINRCYARIEECEIREAQLEPGSDPKFRATNDRDRDRAFIALRRAMKALKELRAELAEMPASVPTASNVIPMPVKALPVQALPAIARNSLCPCKSGEKYKRCCGRSAPPLPGNFRHIQPHAS